MMLSTVLAKRASCRHEGEASVPQLGWQWTLISEPTSCCQACRCPGLARVAGHAGCSALPAQGTCHGVSTSRTMCAVKLRLVHAKQCASNHDQHSYARQHSSLIPGMVLPNTDLDVQVLPGLEIHNMHIEVVVLCLRQQLPQHKHLWRYWQHWGVIHCAIQECWLALEDEQEASSTVNCLLHNMHRHNSKALYRNAREHDTLPFTQSQKQLTSASAKRRSNISNPAPLDDVNLQSIMIQRVMSICWVAN